MARIETPKRIRGTQHIFGDEQRRFARVLASRLQAWLEFDSILQLLSCFFGGVPAFHQLQTSASPPFLQLLFAK